ncbi:MAG: metallophosphoesterase [Marinilabiliales bacterium]|nr:MAG: metallophosphoesterase [Marinilabiliales bacterium]
MKNFGFIIFFSVVLVLYALINYYIIRRGLSVIPQGSSLKTWLIFGVSFMAVAFLAGRFLERVSVNWFTATLIWVGSFWLGIMVYLLLQLVLIDLVRLLNMIFGFLPAFTNPEKVRKLIGVTVISITGFIVLAGHINTWFPVVRNIELEVDKHGGNIEELHIVAFSDVHLGTTIEKRHLSIIVDKVNNLKPDLILIPGDIIDEDIAPVIQNNVGEILKQLDARYGVYAVTGNHEYIGGVKASKKYLAEHGVELLNDTALLINDSFYVVGREDLTIRQFTNGKRKELSEIMMDLDRSKPIILMDHQPFKLEIAEQNGVDLQLSGHTHHGQLWPFNYITNMVYELGWGYKKKGTTHFYVSSGVGGWGPPIRTVNRPEIVSIKLKFSK